MTDDQIQSAMILYHGLLCASQKVVRRSFTNCSVELIDLRLLPQASHTYLAEQGKEKVSLD